MRPILVAPDSFKGTFCAVDVAHAIGRGLDACGLRADLCPVADGGEGTLETLVTAVGGRTFTADVRDPVGRPVRALFALINDGHCAVVEIAAASGLGLLADTELDPWTANTYGSGQLIRAAVDAGAEQILVAVGGSATVDGGRGALQAITDAGGLGDVRIVVLCDVRTTWEQCAHIYGPQKGADREMRRLADRLDAFAVELPHDPRGVPMTGAAGGLSGGLWAALGAEMASGAPHVLETIGFDHRLSKAHSVIVGEGRIDEQSVMGKIVGEIGQRARHAGVPLHAIVGRNSLPADAARRIALRSITQATTLEEITEAAERLGREILVESSGSGLLRHP